MFDGCVIGGIVPVIRPVNHTGNHAPEGGTAVLTDAVRSDVNAHNHAISTPIRQVVRELIDLVGATTVAALTGVKETRAVQQWMVDREPQRPHVLRFALQLLSMIVATKDSATAQAWLHGANPALDGQTPITLFRTRPLEEIQRPLLSAARAFASRDE